jgi:hypothetical protein
MKSISAGIFILAVSLAGVKGQTADTAARSKYGLELSQFITESGFAPGTEVIVTVFPDNIKNLSFGLYFCPERKKITGVTIHQEMTLKKFACDKRVTPYAFFNLIYRRTKIRDNADKGDTGEFGMYKSIEHHLGVGVRIKIANDLYFKGAVGYGLYLGSIKRPSDPDPITGEVRGTSGPGAIAKIGLAYKF